MSDVAVAPDVAPSGQTDVPVNPTPVTTPTPIGSQAPTNSQAAPDHKGSEHRPQSRREALDAAFRRAAEAKPAQPRMGHNNPPEPTPRERPAAKPDREKPTLDLRKRPDEQPQQDNKRQDDRPRAEHGHFAPRQQQPQQDDPAAARAQNVRGHAQLPEGVAYRDPPQRMRDGAKADWAKTPESVRGEMHRMHHEFGRAYQQYRGDHETMQTLRPYEQMARESNITLAQAFENYTGMEHRLRNDLVAGLDLIINNLNLRADDGTREGRKLNLIDVAWHIVNQTPEQRQLLQSKNAMMAQTHQLQQANQRIAALEQQNQQAQYTQRFYQHRGSVEHFAKTHPRLDELGEDIVREINHGYDLPTAYRRAELLRPTTQAAQTRTDGPASQTRTQTAQTRTPDRSISGGPGGTSNGTGRPRAPVGRREAIANALKRANGSL